MTVAAIAALAMLGTAACQPATPPPAFTVNDLTLANDANPGDGVCEATAGHDDCTLNAAIDEANALGSGIVELPPLDDYETYGLLDATVTGKITLRVAAGEPPEAFAEVGPANIRVAPGASLVSEAIGYPFGDLTIEGTIVANRLTLVGFLRIAPNGQALLLNSYFSSTPGAAVTNEGLLTLRYSTFSLDFGDSAGIDTRPGATTRLAATAILTSPDADGASACRGLAPTSDGFNAASDTTCSLSGPGDLPADPELWDAGPFPSAGALRDAIAPGTLGCGTTVRTDIRGGADVRPSDGDGDGVAACDIGAWEA